MSSGLNILYTSIEHPGHARIQKFFVRGWPTLRKIFLLVDEGGGGGGRIQKYHYKRAIIGPPAKRHLNGVSLACQWSPNIECLAW